VGGFGDTMEKNFQLSSKKFWQIVWPLREGKERPVPAGMCSTEEADDHVGVGKPQLCSI